MKNTLLLSLIISSLFGCSSSAPNANLDQYTHYTGGLSQGDATSFYWYTERFKRPNSGADYVTSGDYGWYQSDYRWDEGKLRELIREGETLQLGDGLAPYKVHVRFNRNGQAVYQQYRLDGKILPLTSIQLTQFLTDAKSIADTATEQNSNKTSLIQGVWDGVQFESCDGKTFDRIEFNHTLPNFVIDRLSTIHSYAAFVGNTKNNTLTIEELLMLSDDDHGCVKRPVLIPNE